MADIPARLSALAAESWAGTQKTPSPLTRGESVRSERGGNWDGGEAAQPGVTLSECTNLTLLDLRGNPATPEFLASVEAALGCALPVAPNTSVRAPHCDILWLGPDEWLLVGSEADRLNPNLRVERGYVTDVSHGRTPLRLAGPRTRDLLAKGCSLDLHARAFLPGHCAQTSLAHVGVLLHLPRAGDEFDLYFARSYAEHVWHWISAAAAEFG